MRNIPEPTHLEIRIDEWHVAQEDIDAVQVEIKWRGAHEDSTLAKLLAALPPRREFVPIRLVDGRIELAFKSWQGIRFGKGPSIFESARSNYKAWAGEPADPLPAARSYLTEMIRKHLPSFDDHNDKNQVDFIIRTQEKINSIHDSVEALIAHLEYAAPDRYKASPPLKKPRRNIQAAVFCDVMGSSRAGKLLGVPLAPSDEDKYQNQTILAMARLGRKLLCDHFGEAEWKAKVERMREYWRWWEQVNSLADHKEWFYALLAKASGTSAEQERHLAEKDGFGRRLDEWIVVVESRLKLEERLDQWEDHSKGDAEWTSVEMNRRSIQAEQFRIQETDERFDKALSVFEALPADEP